MGLSMAFEIRGAGYGGVSTGSVIFGFNRTGQLQIYTCSLSGSQGLANDAGSWAGFTIPEEPSPQTLPADLAGYTLGFKVSGGVVSKGSTQLDFDLYSGEQNDSIYHFTRRPQVKGVIIGSIDGLGKIFRMHTADWNKSVRNMSAVMSIVKQLGFSTKKKGVDIPSF